MNEHLASCFNYVQKIIQGDNFDRIDAIGISCCLGHFEGYINALESQLEKERNEKRTGTPD